MKESWIYFSRLSIRVHLKCVKERLLTLVASQLQCIEKFRNKRLVSLPNSPDLDPFVPAYRTLSPRTKIHQLCNNRSQLIAANWTTLLLCPFLGTSPRPTAVSCSLCLNQNVETNKFNDQLFALGLSLLGLVVHCCKYKVLKLYM